ncbi:hypothetical protein Plhal304r1_c049g0131841 [Plasmopara halstedii]
MPFYDCLLLQSQHYDPLNFVKGATVLQHTPRMYIRTYENAWLSLLMTLKALIITTSPECRYRLHSHRTKIIITKSRTWFIYITGRLINSRLGAGLDESSSSWWTQSTIAHDLYRMICQCT